MSAIHGGTGYEQGGSIPPRKADFNWISQSWQLFSQNTGVWLLTALIFGLVPLVIGGIAGGMVGATQGVAQTQTANSPFGHSPIANILSGGGLPAGLNIVLRVFGLLWTAYLYAGIFQMALKQMRGLPISVGDAFSGGPLFLNMLGFHILYSLVVFVGVLLCIVPGLIVAGLLLPGYALIADGASISEAFSRSIDAMKKDWGTATGIVFVFGLLMVVTLIVTCGLATLATYPMLWLLSAIAYRDMIGLPNQGLPAASQYSAPQAGVWPPPPTVGQAPPPLYGQPPVSGQPPVEPPTFGQTQSQSPFPEQPREPRPPLPGEPEDGGDVNPPNTLPPV